MKPITGAEYLAAEKYPSLAAFVAASAETYGFNCRLIMSQCTSTVICLAACFCRT